MAGPYRERIFAVAVKVEPTSGTDSVPTLAADAVRVVGVPVLTINDLEPGDRSDVVTGVLGTIDNAAPAGTFGTIDLQVELCGAGAAYSSSVKPPIDALLRMSGFSSTFSTNKYTYTTLDTGMDTASVYCYGGGRVFKLVGCVAAPKLDMEANKRGLATFSVTGKLASIAAADPMGAVTLSAVIPPLFHSAAANIGAWTSTDATEPLVIKKVGLDFGTTVSDRASAGAADGLIGYLITDRKASQAMTVEQVSFGKFDPDTLVKAATFPDTKCAYAIGTVANNRVKFATGTWMLTRPTRAAINALLTWDLAGPLKAGSETVSSREIQITFD